MATATPCRPEVKFKHVENFYTQKWVQGGRFAWPCPYRGFEGKKLEIFWDLQCCPLNAGWPDTNIKLNAEQHVDILYQVFCRGTGVNMAAKDTRKDFSLHAFASSDSTLGKVAGQRQDATQAVCRSYLTTHLCAGQQWPDMENAMRTFLSEARPDDILVLISGEERLLPTVRAAVNDYKVQVLQLYPESYNPAGRWLRAEGLKLVAWAAPWNKFLVLHTKNKLNYSVSEVEAARYTQDLVLSSLKAQSDISGMGIVFLMDATDSMGSAIEVVKQKIQMELLRELQERYVMLRDKFRFAVVAYRDVNEAQKGRQFEIHDFDADVERVSKFLGSVEGGGGGDFPEDIAGALMEVCKLSGWCTKSTNIIYHVFDDPGHGQRFNATYRPGSKYGSDMYWDKPPEGRRDPSEEIAEALGKLKNELNVVKYWALTIDNRHVKKDKSDKSVPVPSEPTTDATVKALKEIAAGLPSKVDESHCGLGTRGNWVEEVNLEQDVSRLVRVMISAGSRTLGAVASSSRTLSARADRSKVTVTDQELDVGVAAAVEDAAQKGDLGLAVAVRTDTGLAQPSKTSTEAARWEASSGYRASWKEQLPDTFYNNIKKNFRQKDKFYVQDVLLSQLAKPDGLDDLMQMIQDKTSLATHGGICPKRTYRIMKNPFAKGAERFAYLAKESLDYQSEEELLYVFKEFRMQGTGMKSEDRLLRLITSQTVAGYLAGLYNRAVGAKRPEEIRLEYLEAMLGQFGTGQGRGKGDNRNRFVEKFILGRWRRFSTNDGAVADSEDYLEVCDAFSHWTYWVTEGQLMVTDVQGWLDAENRLVRLTDPCTHCRVHGLLDDVLKDRSLVGMEEYFHSHTCNDVCRSLGLEEKCNPNTERDKLRRDIAEEAVRYKAVLERRRGRASRAKRVDASNTQVYLDVLKRFLGERGKDVFGAAAAATKEGGSESYCTSASITRSNSAASLEPELPQPVQAPIRGQQAPGGSGSGSGSGSHPPAVTVSADPSSSSSSRSLTLSADSISSIGSGCSGRTPALVVGADSASSSGSQPPAVAVGADPSSSGSQPPAMAVGADGGRRSSSGIGSDIDSSSDSLSDLFRDPVCYFYREGRCKKGDDCDFRHPPCYHFKRGKCRYGDKCRYRHVRK